MTKEEKAAAAQEKKAAAAAAKAAKLGGSVPTQEITIDEAYLAAHPDLSAQGFAVGQKIEVPIETTKAAAPKEAAQEEREPLDEATLKSEPRKGEKGEPIWYVKIVAPGQFRLYNEFGQAVSPVTSDPLTINRAASRNNALIAARLK